MACTRIVRASVSDGVFYVRDAPPYLRESAPRLIFSVSVSGADCEIPFYPSFPLTALLSTLSPPGIHLTAFFIILITSSSEFSASYFASRFISHRGDNIPLFVFLQQGKSKRTGCFISGSLFCHIACYSQPHLWHVKLLVVPINYSYRDLTCTFPLWSR
ncbi:hypothetical protein BDV10DRAFT_140786 [Aspergillus recurvatus]